MYGIYFYKDYYDSKNGEWREVNTYKSAMLTDVKKVGNTIYFMYDDEVVWCLEKQDIIKFVYIGKHIDEGGLEDVYNKL